MLPPLRSGYAALPAVFHQPVEPTPLPEPHLAAWNPLVAADLGLADEPGDYLAELAGNALPPGSHPTAAAYAGHQFGGWVSELGDGRAIVLGELVDRDRSPQELVLKGAGPTRWSRHGDGRAVLRSTIREYLASAAMEGLGVPTTRALAIVASPLPVYRERTETAAVLTRVAPTHVRFGTFEYLAAAHPDNRQQLADWVIERFFPGLLTLPSAERYAAWYTEVVARTARLMAAWTAIGFAHGVMNTDNFSILGLTLDYGPFGWLDRYDPFTIGNHSDHAGRYGFDQQPVVGLWNCARLGEALYPLVDEAPARAALDRYRPIYIDTVQARMRDRLGLVTARNDDPALIGALLDLMHAAGADYHRTFRALSDWDGGDLGTAALRREVTDQAALDGWLERYRERLDHEQRSPARRQAAMRAVNPRYVLRNWVAEAVIQAAESGEFGLIDRVRRVLDRPFDEHSGMEAYAAAPPEGAAPVVVSCSS
jgi:uncharacterized protein YdiU (UPF0061 family)